MDELEVSAFTNLFKAVFEKCFGHPPDTPMSESESKHLSNTLEEKTGLVVGWKSIKNYSAFVLSAVPDKKENPSPATLDTLARYVFNAPLTTEVQRRKNESHYPYWFRYKEQSGHPAKQPPAQKRSGKRIFIAAGLIAAILLCLIWLFFRPDTSDQIVEDFKSVVEKNFYAKGWFLQSEDTAYWNRRGENPEGLTLFTLQGDNWPKTGETPRIRNLLLRKIGGGCFNTEVHLSSFIPRENWQQAGILLLEDTSFAGKSIRLSLSYNNFFGGFVRPAEILIQGIASYGKNYANLEEFMHLPLFEMNGKTADSIVANNLKNFAFRIEKQDRKYRFLYSASPLDNFSFKELTTYEFDMKPKFVGIFALKGFVDSTAVIPATIKFFRLESRPCAAN